MRVMYRADMQVLLYGTVVYMKPRTIYVRDYLRDLDVMGSDRCSPSPYWFASFIRRYGARSNVLLNFIDIPRRPLEVQNPTLYTLSKVPPSLCSETVNP